MRRAIPLILLPALMAQAPAAPKDAPGGQAARAKRERLLSLYQIEAAGYAIDRDPTRKEKVTLKREPVYTWTNPVRNGGQDGVVFVWTCRGRAEVIGCFFSFPATGRRGMYHELHSLATTVLDVTRPGAHTWHPGAPGVTPVPIPDAPAPARSATQRLAQIRALTRDFSANSVDKEAKRWDLRLLPQPLYRYESTDPDVPDGALFAYVTSSGTDPEVILVIESRRPAGGGDPVWHYAIARFSDQALWVRHRGREVFKAPDIPYGSTPEQQDPKYRYITFRDREIPPVEGEAP